MDKCFRPMRSINIYIFFRTFGRFKIKSQSLNILSVNVEYRFNTFLLFANHLNISLPDTNYTPRLLITHYSDVSQAPHAGPPTPCFPATAP